MDAVEAGLLMMTATAATMAIILVVLMGHRVRSLNRRVFLLEWSLRHHKVATFAAGLHDHQQASTRDGLHTHNVAIDFPYHRKEQGNG